MAADRYTLRAVVFPKDGHVRKVVELVVDGQGVYGDFLKDLQRSDPNAAKKAKQMFDMLAKAGEEYYKGDETKLRDVGEGVFEIKPGGKRVALMRQDDVIVILGAISKPGGQSNKRQSQWIKQMHERRSDFIKSQDQ